MFTLKDDSLASNVASEFRGLGATLKSFLFKQHNEDGTHHDVTVDSLTLNGGRVGEITDIAYDPALFTSDIHSWVVGTFDFGHLRYTQVGQIITVWFSVHSTSFPGGAVNSLYIHLPNLYRLPAKYDEGGGLIINGSYCGGIVRCSDAGGSYIETVQAGTIADGTLLIMNRPSGTFSGVDADYRGFCTFPITLLNTPPA